MFTGIIRQIGTIKTVTPRDELIVLEIQCAGMEKKKSGDSIAVDGACLTVVQITEDGFTTEAMPETLEKTISKNYQPGTKVNIEEPLKIGDELNGHFVSGHVDYVGKVQNIKEDQNTKTIHITVPEKMQKYFALKGSVTINGVSLTISDIGTGWFGVSLIPETLQQTNLGALKKDDSVNIEVDLISRYLDSLMKDKEKQASYEFLQERGFL
ncbi:riboflavin synthase [Candidatus Peregrinibacteria bacterium]|nr:riboflavin synthase [Candidatus Peregrinibacteria bacterium]